MKEQYKIIAMTKIKFLNQQEICPDFSCVLQGSLGTTMFHVHQSTLALRTPHYYRHSTTTNTVQIPDYKEMPVVSSQYYGLSLLQTPNFGDYFICIF